MFTFEMSFEEYAKNTVCTCGSLRYGVHTPECDLAKLREEWSTQGRERWKTIKEREREMWAQAPKG